MWRSHLSSFSPSFTYFFGFFFLYCFNYKWNEKKSQDFCTDFSLTHIFKKRKIVFDVYSISLLQNLIIFFSHWLFIKCENLLDKSNKWNLWIYVFFSFFYSVTSLHFDCWIFFPPIFYLCSDISFFFALRYAPPSHLFLCFSYFIFFSFISCRFRLLSTWLIQCLYRWQSASSAIGEPFDLSIQFDPIITSWSMLTLN